MCTLGNRGKSTCLNSLRFPLIRNIPIKFRKHSFEQLGINEQLPSDEINYVIVSIFPLASF